MGKIILIISIISFAILFYKLFLEQITIGLLGLLRSKLEDLNILSEKTEIKNEPTDAAKSTAKMFSGIGINDFNNKRYKHAIYNLTKALECVIDPNYYAYRGNANFHLGNIDDAISDFHRAMMLNRKEDSYYIRIGYFKSLKNNYKDAIWYCKEAISINPKPEYYQLIEDYTSKLLDFNNDVNVERKNVE